MNILSITDQKGCRSGGWSGNSGRTYHLELLVITDDPAMGSRAVLKGMGLHNGMWYRWPLMSIANEWDYGSFIQAVDIKENAEDGKSWRVSLDFGPFDWMSQGGATSEAAAEGMFDPFAIPPQVRWGSAKFERSITKDALGVPIVNTAGDPFDPPLKRDDSRPSLQIVRNEPNFNGLWAQLYKDHVNKDVFLGFDPQTVKCLDITANRVYHTDYGYYWEVTYDFEIREYIVDDQGNVIVAGWYEQILNAGLRYLSVSDGKAHPINLDGAPVTAPVLLTKSGQYIGADQTQAYYLTFQLYPTADFDKLNIPDDLLTVGSAPGGGGS